MPTRKIGRAGGREKRERGGKLTREELRRQEGVAAVAGRSVREEWRRQRVNHGTQRSHDVLSGWGVTGACRFKGKVGRGGINLWDVSGLVGCALLSPFFLFSLSSFLISFYLKTTNMLFLH